MINIDTKKGLQLHRYIIENNKLLHHVYEGYYRSMASEKAPEGKKVELGSGSGFLKRYIPSLITSDVIGGPGIDKVFFAEKMPFKSKTVGAFYMLNVFHHIKNPEAALKEMNRTLVKGGKIIMIETNNSLWARYIYKNFHKEPFDEDAGWKINGKRRLSDSNQALPWIIFVRDRKMFIKKFPHLKILLITPHTPLKYILSGGLSHPPFVPTIIEPFINLIEVVLTPLNKYCGLFVTIVIKKI